MQSLMKEEILEVMESLHIPHNVWDMTVYDELVEIYKIISRLKRLGVRLTDNSDTPLDAGPPV